MADGQILVDWVINTKGFDVATKSAENISKGAKNISKAFTDANSGLNQMADGSMKLGLAFAPASIAAAKLAKDIFTAGKSFESAFAGVEKTVDAPKQEMDLLRQSIIDLSQVIPMAADDLAGIAENAGQLGIKTGSIIKFTDTIAKLGVATNLTNDEASSMLAKFANVTGMSQDDFDRLGSTIVSLGNNFATTEKDIVEMGQRLASAGSTVGMTEPQIMAMATALSSVGVGAEVGGSAFSRLMLDIQGATAKGGAKLEEFARVSGMSAKDFQKAWSEDSGKAMEQFVKGLGKMSPNELIKTMDKLGIKQVQMRNAIMSSAKASGLFGDAMDNANQAWKDNEALTAEADTRFKTLDSQLQLLKNSFTAIFIKVFDTMKPSIDEVVKKLQDFTKKIQEMDPKKLEMIVKGLVGLALTAPLLIGLSGAIKLVKTGLEGFNMITGVVSKLTGIGTSSKTAETALEATAVASKNATSKGSGLMGMLTGINPIAVAAGVAFAGLGTAIYLHKKGYEESVKNAKTYRDTLDELSKQSETTKENLEALENRKQAGDNLNDEDKGKLSVENAKKRADEKVKIEEKYNKQINKLKDKNLTKEEKATQTKEIQSKKRKKLLEVETKGMLEQAKVENKGVKAGGRFASVGKDGEVSNVAAGKTKEQKKLIDDLAESVKGLEGEEKALALSRAGLITSFDGDYYYQGKKITDEVKKGLEENLSPDQLGALKSSLGDLFKYENGEFEIAGKKISSSLFSGLSPEQIEEKTAFIKQALNEGLTFEGEDLSYGDIKISEKLFDGLNPEQITEKMNLIKTVIDSGFSLDGEMFVIEGQKISAGLFSGLTPEATVATMNIIKASIQNGAYVDLSPQGIKTMASLEEPLKNVDFSASKEKISAQLNKIDLKSLSPEARKQMETLKSGYSSKSKDVKSAAQKTADGTKKIKTPDLKSVGSDAGTGMGNGVLDKLDFVKNAAQKLADSIPSVVKKFLGIHSPSRVMIKLFGYVVQGSALGVTNNLSKMAKAGTQMTSVFVNSIKKSLNNAQLETAFGNNRLNLIKQSLRQVMLDPKLSQQEKDNIKKRYDELIKEEETQSKRAIEAGRRQDVKNSQDRASDNKYNKGVAAANKKKNVYTDQISKLRQKRLKTKNKKTQAKIDKKIKSLQVKQKANANKLKRQYDNRVKALSNVRDKEKGINDQNYQLKENDAKMREKLEDEKNKFLEEASKERIEQMEREKEATKNILNNTNDEVEKLFKESMNNWKMSPTFKNTQHSVGVVNVYATTNNADAGLVAEKLEGTIIDTIDKALGGL